MLRSLYLKISEAVQASAGESCKDRKAALRLCTAALMVEIARADHEFSEDELETLLRLISGHFGLSTEDAMQLANEANERAEDAVSAHEFTKELHAHLSETEKADVVSLLWQVAYADARLDKYEDSLVLKISDLLYVSRGKVMRLKDDARAAAKR